MEFKEKRRTETVYLPTKRWLRSRNPRSKKEILAWYKREKNILDKRRFQRVSRKLEAFTAEQDRSTKKISKRSKQPQDFTVDCWRLSEKDYRAYCASLKREYQRIKDAYNAQVQAERGAKAQKQQGN